MKYPHQEPPPSKRTHKDAGKDIEKYKELKKTYIEMKKKTNKLHVHGFINEPVLLKLKYFDIIDGFVPDYMHNVLLGIVRQFLRY